MPVRTCMRDGSIIMHRGQRRREAFFLILKKREYKMACLILFLSTSNERKPQMPIDLIDLGSKISVPFFAQ